MRRHVRKVHTGELTNSENELDLLSPLDTGFSWEYHVLGSHNSFGKKCITQIQTNLK